MKIISIAIYAKVNFTNRLPSVIILSQNVQVMDK